MVEVHEASWKRRAGWWTHNRGYALFMLREVGGSLTAVYGVVLLFLLYEWTQGESSFDAYVSLIQSPLVLILTAVALFFILAHAFTWFLLIGKSQPVMSKYRSPSWEKIFGGMIVLFLLVSGAVLFIVFGGL